MRKPHRLRLLRVSITGKDNLLRGFSLLHDRIHASMQRGLQVTGFTFQIKAKIGDDLIIAAATGMDFRARLAGQLGQPPLKRHVNILVLRQELKTVGTKLCGNALQSVLNAFLLRR